jgi:Mg-chelatase subunit ChlD
MAALIAASGAYAPIGPAYAQTAQGELEGRDAPVALRRCLAGANVGSLCNQNGDCPGSSCKDRNIFNVSVAVLFNASAAQLTSIQNALSAGSARLFDATDGQAQFGQATIHNNAFGTTEADFRISTTGVWWNANTGNWKVGGAVNVSIDNIQAAGAPGESVAHEFLHLAFDPRDEYESRAAGCGVANPGDSCPIAGSGGNNCLMDQGGVGAEGQFSELCWGQGDNADITDFGNGDHDAGNTTEQSRCRANRSCWDQVVWSYPNTMAKPAAAPDPAANGAVVAPMKFRVIDNTARVVLVLDRSGSMVAEAPSRMERLKTAANDFIALAENNTELGIVAFATNVTDELAIGALGANRAAWTNLVSGLTPTTRTNIGGALDRARQLITNAGGVTGNTFVVLMTDGLNNEPLPVGNAAATLNAAIASLLAAGIEVYVTCTGGDLGLESQCSEIATGTGGFYVDSADAQQLPLSFAEIAARGFGHEMIGEFNAKRRAALVSMLQRAHTDASPAAAVSLDQPAFEFLKGSNIKPQNLLVDHLPFIAAASGGGHSFFVEKGSDSALFTLQWPSPKQKLTAVAVSPSGTPVRMKAMPLGLFAQVPRPEPGVWTIKVTRPPGAPTVTDYTARAYSRNQEVTVSADVRHASVKPGEPLYVFAYPRTNGHAISSPLRSIKAMVTRPDGRYDLLELSDQGRDAKGQGDDIADDGVFTGVYRKTDLRGAYHISSFWAVNEWGLAQDAIGHTFGKKSRVKLNKAYLSPALMREIRVSATVIHPGRDIEKRPEDPAPGRKTPAPKPGGATGR